MTRYLLNAAGPDRTGLVAAVSKRLFALGCNLEDTSMTRLQGEFAMLVIFSAPKGSSPSTLARKLAALGRNGIAVNVKPLKGNGPKKARPGGGLRLVTVYGPDQAGIVYRVAAALARRKFNVTDLATHRTTGPAPGYILYIEGESPPGTDDRALESALRAETSALGLTISMKPLDPAAL